VTSFTHDAAIEKLSKVASCAFTPLINDYLNFINGSCGFELPAIFRNEVG